MVVVQQLIRLMAHSFPVSSRYSFRITCSGKAPHVSFFHALARFQFTFYLSYSIVINRRVAFVMPGDHGGVLILKNLSSVLSSSQLSHLVPAHN